MICPGTPSKRDGRGGEIPMSVARAAAFAHVAGHATHATDYAATAFRNTFWPRRFPGEAPIEPFGSPRPNP